MRVARLLSGLVVLLGVLALIALATPTVSPAEGAANTPPLAKSDGYYVEEGGTLDIYAARTWGSYGGGDGQFDSPTGVALDDSGNVYVADYFLHRIQKFDRDGGYLGQWGSSGSGDGKLQYPRGIALDSLGRVYVTEFGNDRVQVFDGDGGYLDQWGSLGSGDGQFNEPCGLAVDEDGRVYVADRDNQRIQVFDDTGTYLAQWGSPGSGDGEFGQPWDVAIDGSGHVLVADSDNNRIQTFSKTGAYISQFGTQGTGPGELWSPKGVAVDGAGYVFVADSFNHRVQKLSSTGAFAASWGSEGFGDGQFSYPSAVAVDPAGNGYVADTGNDRIQRLDNGVLRNDFDADGDPLTAKRERLPSHADVFTLLPDGSFRYTHDGSETVSDMFSYRADDGVDVSEEATVAITITPVNDPPTAVDDSYTVPESGLLRVYAFTTWGVEGTGDGQFDGPLGVAVSDAEKVYVVDTDNHRVQRFSHTGAYVTQWGSFGSGNSQFQEPAGVAIDGSNNVFVVDTVNHRVQKFDGSGGYLMQWGGQGSGDGQFDHPAGVAVDGSGHVYVADALNDRIQKFDGDGGYLTQWGTSGSGNGQFRLPLGVAVDWLGDVYVADTENNRIQKFDLDGGFLAKWGNAGSGDGQFDRPSGIGVDLGLNVYVADQDNDRIQQFTSSGDYLAQWGSGGPGPGEFYDPFGLAVDLFGNVYVADTRNHRIQRLDHGVLANDSDAEGGSMVAVLETPPAHHDGLFALNADGSFTYTHDGSEATEDSFTYTVGDGTSRVATVELSFPAPPEPPGRVGNLVWLDVNGNGVFNPTKGDVGIDGVTVELWYETQSSLLDSVVSGVVGGAGGYRFDASPGVYWVRVVAPSGRLFTQSNVGANDSKDSDADASGWLGPITITSGVTNNTWDAGLLPPGATGFTRVAIGNTAWWDVNGDGKRNGPEPRVEGMTVELLANDGSTVLLTTTTNATGTYKFIPIEGEYYVHFVAPDGSVLTTQGPTGGTDEGDSDADPATGITDLIVVASGIDKGWDVGVMPAGATPGTASTLGDRVWLDGNTNGVKNSNSTDPGFPDVTVELWSSDQLVLLKTDVTDVDGFYKFKAAPGPYFLKVLPPVGYGFTAQNVGSDDARDSDFDPATGWSDPITLAEGVIDKTWDAGLVDPPA